MMLRYLVFAYDDFYPHGGMEDCELKTNNYLEAVARAQELAKEYDNAHVYDVREAQIVLEHQPQ